jgi:hypothetical protein
MALSLSQVTVTTAATPLGVLSPGSSVTLAVPGAGQAVFIGESATVTTTNGFPVFTGGPQITLSLPVTSQPATLYGIVAGTTQTIGVAFASTT